MPSPSPHHDGPATRDIPSQQDLLRELVAEGVDERVARLLTPQGKVDLTKAESILILVHPGSCCGSANMHLGRSQASSIRDAMAAEVLEADAVVVFFGDFSDEIPAHSGLLSACQHASLGIFVPPNDELSFWGKRLAKEFPKAQFLITGAWHEQHGCVTAVADAIGERATVSDSAMSTD